MHREHVEIASSPTIEPAGKDPNVSNQAVVVVYLLYISPPARYTAHLLGPIYQDHAEVVLAR